MIYFSIICLIILLHLHCRIIFYLYLIPMLQKCRILISLGLMLSDLVANLKDSRSIWMQSAAWKILNDPSFQVFISYYCTENRFPQSVFRSFCCVHCHCITGISFIECAISYRIYVEVNSCSKTVPITLCLACPDRSHL